MRGALLLLALVAAAAFAQERTLPLPALRSGITFPAPDAPATPADELANPGLLWWRPSEPL